MIPQEEGKDIKLVAHLVTHTLQISVCSDVCMLPYQCRSKPIMSVEELAAVTDLKSLRNVLPCHHTAFAVGSLVNMSV